MSELQIIEAVLQRTVRRRRLERAWRGFWKGLLAGGALWFVVLTAYKLFPLPAWSLPAAGIAGGVLALAGLVAGAARRISVLETARWIDQRRHLQERLGTAVEVSQSVDATWRTLVIGDAARHAQDLNVRELLPFRFQTAGRWALLLLLASAGLGFVPEYRSQRSRQKQQDAAQIRETGRKLVELTRRSVEQRKPLLEPTQKAVDAVAELGEKLQAQSLTRTEALRELASVTDKLNQQARELEKNPALQRLERAARESGGGATAPGERQKQMQSLQKSLGQAAGHPEKLDRLQKDLEKLRQNAASLPDKSTPEGAAAREQMSQALADLARQAQELGANAAGIEEAIQAMQADRTDLVAQDLNSALKDLEKMQAMAPSS